MRILFSLLVLILVSSCASYGKSEHCKKYKLEGDKCDLSWQKYTNERVQDILDRPYFDRR